MRNTLLLALSLALNALPCRADLFHLKSGGSLEGKLLNEDETPRRTYNISLSTGGQIALDADHVAEVTRVSQERDEYEKLLPRMPDTVRGHLTMAEWCKRRNLLAEREFHLQHVIRLDPDHEEARRLLDYQKTPDGKWARREEIMRDRGYESVRGRWRLPQQQAVEDSAKQFAEESIQWQKNVRMWEGWLSGRRAEEAWEKLSKITDPAAIEAVGRLLNHRDPRLRELAVDILARIGSPEAYDALAAVALHSSDGEMRLYSLRQLKDSPGRARAESLFLAALQTTDTVQINRAATGLGELRSEAAVVPLINVLTTTQRYKVNLSGPNELNVSSAGGLGVGKQVVERTRVLENKSVLDALIAITKQNFQYSSELWKRWYLQSTIPPDLDLRRDQ
jgi:hypothetical protein